MTEKIIEIEAETLEEAREQVRSQIPEGLQVLSEQIISDGNPKTVTDFADTIEEAFSKAQSRIPSNADVLEKREVSAPGQKVVKITVEAHDEQSAVSNVEWKAKEQGHTGTVQNVRLVIAGRKGFLGVGAKPNQYEVELLEPQPAVVEITYKTKARVSAKIGDLKQNRRTRAIEWWRNSGSSSKKCDVCNRPVQSDNGYLLDTSEIIQSRKYVEHAAELRAKKTLRRSNIPGLDSVVTEALMPAMNFLSESDVIADIRKVTTPWLVCDNCLGKYFAET